MSIFSMNNVTPDQFAQLEEWYPGRFQIEYNRDLADYVYEAEKLATLSGEKASWKAKSYQQVQGAIMRVLGL